VLNIEIKGSFPESVPVAQELARVLTEQDRLDAAVVTAFDDELAEAFHELAPSVEITPGLDAMTRYVLAGERPAEGRRIMQVPPEYSGVVVLTPELVARAHADGMVLWIWPNERGWEDAAGYQRLLELGVDGINAADPDVALEVVRAAG
jgi:glycerophosphoryl diester phosphodiesterase